MGSWKTIPKTLPAAIEDWPVQTAVQTLLEGSLAARTHVAGDMWYASAIDEQSSLAVGSAGQIMGITSSLPAWVTPSTYLAHTLLDGSYHTDTTAGTVVRGDLVTGQGASPTWTRLPLGAANTFLRSDGTDALWSTLTLPNAATLGDVVYASAANTMTMLGIGAAGGLFIVGGAGIPAWFAPGGGNAVFQMNAAGNAPVWNAAITDTQVVYSAAGVLSGSSGFTFTAASSSVVIGGWLNTGGITLAAAQGDLAAGTNNTDKSFFYDASNESLSISDHGLTLGTNDFAIGNANRYVHWDDSAFALKVVNTFANSLHHAVLWADVTSTSGGDPQVRLTINGGTTTGFIYGLDNDDSDNFKMGFSNAVGTSTAFQIARSALTCTAVVAMDVGTPGWTLATADFAVGSSATNRMVWDDSAASLTLGTNAIYSQGAHGLTLAADDWAVGSSSTSNAQWDNSARLLVSRGIFHVSPTSAASPLGAVDLQLGRMSSGADAGTNDLCFQYGASGGGYRHWITTWHNAAVGSGNRINFYLNSSATAGGSSAPATGNDLVMWIRGTSANLGELYVSGWFNLNTTTLATARGDFATGVTGASQLFYDQSADTLLMYGTGAAIFNQFSSVAGTATVFNEQGADIDTRIEGDTNSFLAVFDAGLDAIGFGSNAASDRFINQQKTWTSTSGVVYNSFFTTTMAPASASTASLYGYRSLSQHTTAFNLSTIAAAQFNANTTAGFSAGTLSNLVGIDIIATLAGAGATTAGVDIRVRAPSVTGATPTTWTQLDLQDPGSGAGTTIMGIRQRGTNAHNRLNGNTMIGADSAPSHPLHVTGKILTTSEIEIDGALNHDGTQIAFFNGSLATQQSDIGAITDNTGGSVDGTLVDVGPVYDQAILNNNLADLAAKINSLRTVLRAYSLTT